MASIIDTVRSVLSEKNSILKLLVISAIFSYPVFQTVNNFEGWFGMWTIISYVVGILYLGYILSASHNLINEKGALLSGFFNPFKIFFVGIGGILALAPMIALMGYVGYCLFQILTNIGLPVIPNYTIVGFVEILFLGVLSVQMTLYTIKYNPFYAYNLVKIFQSFLTFALKSILLMLVLAIISAFTLYPLGYLSYMMFDVKEYPFFLIMAVFATLLLIIITQYYSQMAMENTVLNININYQDDAGSIMDKELLLDKDR